MPREALANVGGVGCCRALLNEISYLRSAVYHSSTRAGAAGLSHKIHVSPLIFFATASAVLLCQPGST